MNTNHMENWDRPLLRTRERDSRKPGAAVRGVRHWTSAEVPGDVWFMVECAVPADHHGLKFEVKRHVTVDFWEARSVYARTAYKWARICAYVRAPSLFVPGHIFEPLAEVSQVGTSKRLLFRFQSGLMVDVADGKVSHGIPLDVVRRVFPLT